MFSQIVNNYLVFTAIDCKIIHCELDQLLNVERNKIVVYQCFLRSDSFHSFLRRLFIQNAFAQISVDHLCGARDSNRGRGKRRDDFIANDKPGISIGFCCHSEWWMWVYILSNWNLDTSRQYDKQHAIRFAFPRKARLVYFCDNWMRERNKSKNGGMAVSLRFGSHLISATSLQFSSFDFHFES